MPTRAQLPSHIAHYCSRLCDYRCRPPNGPLWGVGLVRSEKCGNRYHLPAPWYVVVTLLDGSLKRLRRPRLIERCDLICPDLPKVLRKQLRLTVVSRRQRAA